MKNSLWNLSPITSIANVYLGGTPSRSMSQYWGGEVKWASAKDIAASDQRYIFETSETITKTGLENSAAKLLEKDTVVITARGTVGAIRMLGTPMSFNQTCYGLVAKDVIDPTFMFYALKAGIEDIKSLTYGTVFDTITIKTFDSLMIPIPSLSEQRAIAGVLGALDDKIELNRRMNRTLEAIARAVYKEMMAAKKGRETTIGEVATIVGGSTPSTINSKFWEGGEINWATPKDLATLHSPILLDTNNRITESGLKKISSGLLPIGTVLLSSRAPIGYLAITQIPVAINQGFIAIRCKEEAPNYFLINWLKDNMEEIIGRANGTTFLEISKSNFRPMLIFIPAPEKMKEFVKTVEPLYQKMTANLKESHTLAGLRDALLPKLMRGEVRVAVHE